MTLHIFNPEHDIALASNLPNFTAPHAGRQLSHDLGFIPAIWADDDERVLVDNIETAQKCFGSLRMSARRLLGKELAVRPDMFVCDNNPHRMASVRNVEPWGWNRALKHRLLKHGVEPSVLYDDDKLDVLRELSHRHTAARLLPSLLVSGTVGNAYEASSAEEVMHLVGELNSTVLKAPWSSSGRGIRFVNTSTLTGDNVRGWIKNMMESQGSVMVEPFYNKVKDFGMEFESMDDGSVRYLGLSLFHTSNGAYTGNIVAQEKVKQKLLSNYISPELLCLVKDLICRNFPSLLDGRYVGPFGVDMMVVNTQPDIPDAPLSLHPCVEVNLRRTMGHVALALTPDDEDLKAVMRIDYSNNTYKIKLEKLYGNY